MARLSDGKWQELRRALVGIGSRVPEWTDPGGHDPGITILELLAFAAEEIAARPGVVTAEDQGAIGRIEEALAVLGPRTAVSVRVDGDAWTPVDDFADSGPGDRHYVLDPGTGEITFGDGTRGRVPPRGGRVRADYRYGAVASPAVTLRTDWPPRDWSAAIGLRPCGSLRVTPDTPRT